MTLVVNGLLCSATVMLLGGQNGDVIELALADFPIGLKLENISTHQFLVCTALQMFPPCVRACVCVCM